MDSEELPPLIFGSTPYGQSLLGESGLIEQLIDKAKQVIASFSALSLPVCHKDFRSLIWKVEILFVLFEYIQSMKSCVLPANVILCLKKLFFLLYQSKILLDDLCFRSSRIAILLQSSVISRRLYDICKEMLIVLEMFPLQEIDLCEDVVEYIELLKKQLGKKEVYMINPLEEAINMMLLGFVDDFEAGRVPEKAELKTIFLDVLGIQDAKTCRSEMEFLGKWIMIDENEILKGILAVVHYCRFLFFGFGEDEVKIKLGQPEPEELEKDFPIEYCCPISLELMQDPVIVSTGQTYDRTSISEWLQNGNRRCPMTRQQLAQPYLVPNRALKSVISRWCLAHGISFDFDPMEILSGLLPTRAVTEANKATGGLLVQLLASHESIGLNIIAAHELHLLAKSGKETQAHIAEAGGIHILQRLLFSDHSFAQGISMKAIYFLSKPESNKSLVIEQAGESIVHVIINGHTDEAKEVAIYTLLGLCEAEGAHDCRARVAGIPGAVGALLRVLEGIGKGKIAALTTLLFMSRDSESCSKLIEAGSVKFLTNALTDEELMEHASAVFVYLVRQTVGAQAVKEDLGAVVALLIQMRHSGSPRVKLNAAIAIQELFKKFSFNFLDGWR